MADHGPDQGRIKGRDATPAGSATGSKRRVWRFMVFGLLAIVLLAVAARAALPWYLQSYVNRTLDQSPDYDGHVGEIDVHLWRGAYSIEGMEIVEITHTVPVPFFEARRVDFSLSWNALLRGEARGKMVMEQPRLNFVHGPSEEETQTGAAQPWLRIIDDLYPFRIDKAIVHDGKIHFQAFHTRPQVDVYLSNVEGSVENLTNIEDKVDPLIATVTATGVATDSGEFDFKMTFDPQAHRPSFDLATRLLDVEVTQLNTLTQAYGDFDFERGRFDLVVELSTRDGFLGGYAKPLFRDLQIVTLREFDIDDPLQFFWEALVGIVGEIFKNQSRDQFGTRMTLEGDLDNPRTSLLEIIGSVLRNAFVRAYLPKIEGRVAPELVEADESD